jgi:D-amino-acid oxidase
MTQRMRIWRFANEIAKGELHCGADGFKVLKFDMNFSAKRQGGPRVEVQGSGTIGRVWVVHAYGRNELVFQNSVGCAEKIVRLISGL